eukprot:763946-Hanusia_phi.AAC.4
MAGLMLVLGGSCCSCFAAPPFSLLPSFPSSFVSPPEYFFRPPSPHRSPRVSLVPSRRLPAIPLLATLDPSPRFSPGDLEIDWAKRRGGGGFGEVFFGGLKEGDGRGEEVKVVAKVPYLQGDGRKAWSLERYVNVKMMARGGAWRNRFMPRYLGCSSQRAEEGQERKLAMVWEREDGKTLQEHLVKAGSLSSVLGVKDQTKTIRPIFCEKVRLLYLYPHSLPPAPSRSFPCSPVATFFAVKM